MDENSDEFQDVVKEFYDTIKEFHNKIKIVKVGLFHTMLQNFNTLFFYLQFEKKILIWGFLFTI